tara:strand:+ start:463 stop:846 length:384 start_codon:yes stop_codon:yes gene_type:complete
MKKLLTFLILSILFTSKAISYSLPADAIILICSTGNTGGDVSFEVLLVPSTKEGLNGELYDGSLDKLQITDSFYQLSGFFNKGISQYTLKINRTNGRYTSIWYGKNGSFEGSRQQAGKCEIKKENKF